MTAQRRRWKGDETVAGGRAGLAWLVAAGVLLLAACERVPGPNVVLVTLDTVRADRLGTMGDAAARTPALDALGARGVVFERAYASVPLTLPSHTTMLTGLEVYRHGVHDNGRFVVAAAHETVAERLAARGYDTAAFVAAFVLDASFGLAQGFRLYDDAIDRGGDPLSFAVPARRGAEVTDRALAWLATRRRRPFFLWVHYYDVHAPRVPPPPFDALGDPYAGELAYVDAEVGRLLAGVERAAGGRETLVIAIGDHGEGLGDHGELTHGILAYDATLHVPLIVAGPGFPAGRRVRRLARTADVAATILAAAGAPPVAGAEGRPLQERLREDDGEPRLAYFESFGPEYTMGWARLGGMRDERWKYTAEPAPVELYDVLADPGETVNVAADHPEVVARLDEHYRVVRPPALPAGEAAAALPLAAQEKLAALGYLTHAAPRAPAERHDPRRYAAAIGWIDAARGLAMEGNVAGAVEALEIFASRPMVEALALRSLAPLYLLVGRDADAVAARRRLVELTGTTEAAVDLALTLVQAGRADEALAALATVAAGDPPPRLRVARARALVALDRPGEAEREVDAVLAASPNDDAALALGSRIRAGREGAAAEIPRLQALLSEAAEPARLLETRATLAGLLHAAGRDTEAVALLQEGGEPAPAYRALLAEIHAARGDTARAIALYEALAAEQPAVQHYHRALADLYGPAGRLDDALRAYDRLLAIDPDDPEILVDRGVTYTAAGKPAEAEADYRRALALDDTLPEAHLNLAVLELGAGRVGDAERHLQRALALRPAYAKAHFHLARIYADRNDPRAAEHAERAAAASGGGRAGAAPLGGGKAAE